MIKIMPNRNCFPLHNTTGARVTTLLRALLIEPNLTRNRAVGTDSGPCSMEPSVFLLHFNQKSVPELIPTPISMEGVEC